MRVMCPVPCGSSSLRALGREAIVGDQLRRPDAAELGQLLVERHAREQVVDARVDRLRRDPCRVHSYDSPSPSRARARSRTRCPNAIDQAPTAVPAGARGSAHPGSGSGSGTGYGQRSRLEANVLPSLRESVFICELPRLQFSRASREEGGHAESRAADGTRPAARRAAGAARRRPWPSSARRWKSLSHDGAAAGRRPCHAGRRRRRAGRVGGGGRRARRPRRALPARRRLLHRVDQHASAAGRRSSRGPPARASC